MWNGTKLHVQARPKKWDANLAKTVQLINILGGTQKNCAIVTWKNCNYLIKSYFLYICPNSFNNFEMYFLEKKMEQNTVIFQVGRVNPRISGWH